MSFFEEFEKPSVTNSPARKQIIRKSPFSRGRSQVAAAKTTERYNDIMTFPTNNPRERANSNSRLRARPLFEDSDSVHQPPLSFLLPPPSPLSEFSRNDIHTRQKEGNALSSIFNDQDTAQKKKKKKEDEEASCESLKLVGKKIEIPLGEKELVQIHQEQYSNLLSLKSDDDFDPIEDSDNDRDELDDLYEQSQPAPKKPKVTTDINRGDMLGQGIEGILKSVNHASTQQMEQEIPHLGSESPLENSDSSEIDDNVRERPETKSVDSLPLIGMMASKQTREITRAEQMRSGHIGLSNDGNMCYMNSVLQALFHTTFATDLMAAKFGERERGKRLLVCLRTLFTAINSRREPSVRTSVLKGPIGYYNSDFNSSRQQDAHEFLMCLLSNLYDEIAACLPGGSGPEENFVGTNFSTVLKHEIKCKKCGFSVSPNDSFLSLSLDFQPHTGSGQGLRTSIKDLLRFFFRTSELEHKCEKCGEDSADHRYTIKSAPRYLILHLKRWAYSGTGEFKKDKLAVVPDPRLDLKTFTEGGSMDVSYALCSVVSHKGEVAESGHYVTFVLNEDGRDWIFFSDTLVMPHSEPPSNEESYILVYKRT